VLIGTPIIPIQQSTWDRVLILETEEL